MVVTDKKPIEIKKNKNNKKNMNEYKAKTINDMIAYKAKMNAKPDMYTRKKFKRFIEIYKEQMNNFYLKNFNNFPNKKALAQQLYNKGNYKGYIKTTTKLLIQKKAANAGFLPQWVNSPPPKPASPPKPPKPASLTSGNIFFNTVSGVIYTAVGKLKGEKKIKDLRSLFGRINIGHGIEKIFLRDAGNQFKVIARKNANSTNNVPEIPENRLRMDIFTVMDGKKATIQLFANGAVVITGSGDKSDLDVIVNKLQFIERIEIIRQSGTFYTSKRIPWGKADAFVLFCISKKYSASYERELANYISVYAGKVDKKYKHHMKFYYNGQVGYSTSDLKECRKIIKDLIAEATKKGLTDTVLLLAKNKPKPKDKKKTTCTNPPNPPDSFEGDCAPGYYCRPNSQGFPCCYKIPENLTVGRRTAIAAYKKFGIEMPAKVKKLLFVAFNVVAANGNKMNNVVFNKNKGLIIRKRGWIRYSVEDLAKFAKPLGIDLAKAKKEREGQRKKLPQGGWKVWLHDQMAKKLAANAIVEERVSGSGSNSSRMSYHLASENEPILLPNNNKTHRLIIKPGPPIVISGFIRRDKRRKANEITSRVCTTLDRDVLERIARRVGITEYKKLSKPQLCSAIYTARKSIVPNYASPVKAAKANKPAKAAKAAKANKPAKANAQFRLILTNPDGNCFYEAFLRGLTGGVKPTAEQIASLRRKVKSYYTTEYANRGNNNVVNVNRNNKPLTKTQFLNYVVTNKSWAGAAEIRAVAHKMKTNIIVLTPKYKVHKTLTVRDPSFQYTVYLSYDSEMSNIGTHFNTLIPITKVNSGSSSSGFGRSSGSSSGFGRSNSSGRSGGTNNLAAEFEAAMRENNVMNMPKFP
jgi:uncharacterized membrane protein YgcG